MTHPCPVTYLWEAVVYPLLSKHAGGAWAPGHTPAARGDSYVQLVKRTCPQAVDDDNVAAIVSCHACAFTEAIVFVQTLPTPCTMQQTAIQFSALQKTALQFSYNTTDCRTGQLRHSAIQFDKMKQSGAQLQCNTVQYNTRELSTIQCNTTECSTI